MRRWILLAWLVVVAGCTSGDVVLDDGAAGDRATGEAVSPPTTVATTSTTIPTTTEPTTTQPPPTTVPTPSPIELAVSGMSVDQKIGQLLMPLVAGTSANQVSPAEAAANTKLAGVETPGSSSG